MLFRVQGWQVMGAAAGVTILLLVVAILGQFVLPAPSTPATSLAASHTVQEAITQSTQQTLQTLTVEPSATEQTPLAAGVQLSDIRLEMISDGASDRIAADERSQVHITANVDAAGLTFDGLPMYFSVSGGGSVDPAIVPIAGGQAKTTYTAGTSGSINEALVVGVIDVPRLGRVSDTVTLHLVRQTLTAQPACGYGLTANPGTPASPITVTIAADPPDLIGEYMVRLRVEDGQLSTANGQTGPLTDVLTSPGALTVGFVPPANRPTGDTALCVSFPDRPGQNEVCGRINWGLPATTLDVQTAGAAYWNRGTVPEMRIKTLDGDGNSIMTTANISYRIAASTLANDKFTVYRTSDSRSHWPMDACVGLDIGTEHEGEIVYLATKGASIALWRVIVPGVNNQPLIREWESVQAAQPLLLTNYKAKFLLADGTVLQFDPSKPDSKLAVYAVDSYNPAITPTQVIVRCWVPETVIDPTSRQLKAASADVIHGVTSANAIHNYDSTNVSINLVSSGEIVMYVSSDILNLSSQDNSDLTRQQWRAIYLLAEVETSAIQPRN